MNMCKPLLFISFILFSILPSCGGSGDDGSSITVTEETLDSLNHALENAHVYSDKKKRFIDNLKNKAAVTADSKRKWELMLEISSQYRQVNTDSAIHYARIASKIIPATLSDKDRAKGELTFADALSTAGLFPNAILILDSLNGKLTDISSKTRYWKSSRILYSYMLAFVQNRGEGADTFREKYIECDDSLLAHLPKTDPFRKFIYSERLVSDGRWEEAQRNLQSLLAESPKESNIYGMAAYQLAEVYKNKGDYRNYAESLALSAESDIKACVKEGLALPTLANWLYRQGDVDNAFNYINFALEEANNGNVRMRTVTIVPLMPLIDQTYRVKIESSKNQMLGYLIVSTTLFLIAAALSGRLIRTMHRNKANKQRLAESSKTLEAYVGNFIGLCSNYAMRLDQLANLVTRKISSGQIEDLKKLVSTGRFAEEDNEDFYQLIDKAILDIFPDFVNNINTLLVPEKRIVLKPGETLNPELRIYAFIRLGVDQSTRIAQILHYSANTVYTYRNRMRNRAINRDSFDDDVMHLKRCNE